MSLWNNLDKPLILASASPRRRDILGAMGFSFEVQKPDISDEDTYLKAEDIPGSVASLALAKAGTVARAHPHALVLGGDTVVVAAGRILGKPRSAGDAREMLAQLSGRAHHVYTGVALVQTEHGFSRTDVSCTRVVFRGLDSDEIDKYIASGEYSDKAGAYGIQGSALSFVDNIDGCFYNVVGLPVTATIRLFQLYQSRKDRDHGSGLPSAA